MYECLEDGLLKWEYATNVKTFIAFAKSQIQHLDGQKIRCPCNYKKCRNRAFHEEDVVEYHLIRYGFVPNYHKWVLHGEQLSDEEDEDHVQGRPFTEDEDVGEAEDIPAPEVASTSYHEMVHDLAGPSFTWERTEEQPNIEAQQLYNLIDAANEQLWTGCETMTQLSAMARLMTIKADHRLSERAYDDVLHLWKDSLPIENRLPNNFYETKRFMQGLGLPVEKIDCCTSNCMLFWGDDVELQFCKFCGEQRYQGNEGTATRNNAFVSKCIIFL